MLKFEWNSLRTGDHVTVHDVRSSDLSLTDGVVAMITTHGGTNGIGIRIKSVSGDREILWPSYLAVHGDPPDATEPCWRCESLAQLS